MKLKNYIIFLFIFTNSLNTSTNINEKILNHSSIYSKNIKVLNPAYDIIRNYYELDSEFLNDSFLTFIETSLEYYDINKYIPLELFLSLIDTESQFIDNAKSKAGAYGLTQIMPNTEIIINNQYNNILSNNYLSRLDPYDNVTLSILYLKDLLTRFNYNLEIVLRFYNGGSKWREKPSTKSYYKTIIHKTLLLKKFIHLNKL